MRASYFAAASHVHVKADLPDSGCQGTQSLSEVAACAWELGFDGVLVTPHSANPAAGESGRFGCESAQAQALLRHLSQIRAMNDYSHNFRFFAGIEANLLGDGIDAPPSIASQADFVIASLHGEVPASHDEVALRFQIACNDPRVDALGHPTRHLRDVAAVDWNAVFAAAVSTGTAIELNFNLWYTHLKDAEDRYAHRVWLERAADSGVLFLFSLDIHNAGMWPHALPVEPWSPTERHVERYFELLDLCGIDFGRIINRDVGLFSYLCDLPKEARSRYLQA